MPQLATTSLTRYILTAEESVAGYTLTALNLAVIQNLMADTSESRLALEYDPLNPVKFAQDEAFMQGQLKMLRYLQQMHEESQESYLQLSIQTNQE